MKITDSSKKPVGLNTDISAEKPGSKKVATDASAKSESTAGGAKTESVTLSPLSAQLQSLEAKVAADNVFDTQKVDAIKSAIAGGQFKVDSEKVADGLIETVKDLLTPKKT